MGSNGKLVPKMRFKEFLGDGEWEEKKLGEVCLLNKSKNKDSMIKNVITNSAEFGLIPQSDFFDRDIANEENYKNYTIINKGDFVYNPRVSKNAPYGPINIYNIDDDGIISPLYISFRIKEATKIQYVFLEYFF